MPTPPPAPESVLVTAEMQADPRRCLWLCEGCDFVYDPRDGDPDGGIPPGTAFEDVPDTWFCPVCGVDKSWFTRIAPGTRVTLTRPSDRRRATAPSPRGARP